MKEMKETEDKPQPKGQLPIYNNVTGARRIAEQVELLFGNELVVKLFDPLGYVQTRQKTRALKCVQ